MTILGFLLPAYKDIIDAAHRFYCLAMLLLGRTQILNFIFHVYSCSRALRRNRDPDGTSLLDCP